MEWSVSLAWSLFLMHMFVRGVVSEETPTVTVTTETCLEYCRVMSRNTSFLDDDPRGQFEWRCHIELGTNNECDECTPHCHRSECPQVGVRKTLVCPAHTNERWKTLEQKAAKKKAEEQEAAAKKAEEDKKWEEQQKEANMYLIIGIVAAVVILLVGGSCGWISVRHHRRRRMRVDMDYDRDHRMMRGMGPGGMPYGPPYGGEMLPTMVPNAVPTTPPADYSNTSTATTE